MRISIKKANRFLLIAQILALVTMLFMALKAFKMLFIMLTGAHAL
jgi:uncharacterized membrane protein